MKSKFQYIAVALVAIIPIVLLSNSVVADGDCEKIVDKYSDLFSYESNSISRSDRVISDLKSDIRNIETRTGGKKTKATCLCLYKLYSLIGDDNAAYGNITKYIELNEYLVEPDFFYIASVLSYRLGLYDDSNHYISMAIEKHPAYPHLYFQRAFVNFELGKYEGVIIDISKELEVRGHGNVNDPDLYYLLGKAQFALQDFDAALLSFDQSLKIIDMLFPCSSDRDCYFKKRTDTYNLILKTYCSLGQIDMADKIYNLSKRYSPQVDKPSCN